MYEILIENASETASVNFPAFERNGIVRSCLASALLAKEWDIVNKLLTKGAVLNVTEIPILIEVYLDLVYDGSDVNNDDDSVLQILNGLLKRCHICHRHLIDENGNNPIHKAFENIQLQTKLKKYKIENAVTVKQHINSISKLMTICADWMTMENNKNKLPIEYLFNLMFFGRNENDGQVNVDYEQVHVCNGLMNIVKEKFVSLYTKLTSDKIKQYPICVSYLRLLLLCGCNTSKQEETETYVSLILHFGNIIFDKNIKSTAIVGNSKDLNVYADVSKTPALLDKFVATNFAKYRQWELDINFLMKSIIGNDGYDDDLNLGGAVLEAARDELDDSDTEDAKASNENKNELDETVSSQVIVQEEEEIDKKPLSWIELVYILCVESLSCADLITDFYILIELINDHAWWSTFSVIFMISPYLVSYTAMGSMLKTKSHKLSLIVMTPLCLMYFMILDVVCIIIFVYIFIFFWQC